MNIRHDSSLADQQTTALPSTIVETCLHVADLNRSRKFYSDLFGYSVMKSDERFCAFDVGHGQVLLLFLRGSDPEGTVLPFGNNSSPRHERPSASRFRRSPGEHVCVERSGSNKRAFPARAASPGRMGD